MLSAHSKTNELLYLETGNIPVRFMLKSRRLNFLWYILNEEDDTLLNRFFIAQLNHPLKGDWVSQVKSDMNELDIDYTFDDVKRCSKNAFKTIVKEKVTRITYKRKEYQV